MPTSKSIPLNHLANIVEQYVTEYPDGPQIRIIPSHIDADGVPYGYLKTADTDAIARIETIAAQAETATP